MEGEGWAWKAQATGDLSRRETIRSIANEQPKDIEARFLGESGKAIDGVRNLHNSKTMEIYISHRQRSSIQAGCVAKLRARGEGRYVRSNPSPVLTAIVGKSGD